MSTTTSTSAPPHPPPTPDLGALTLGDYERVEPSAVRSWRTLIAAVNRNGNNKKQHAQRVNNAVFRYICDTIKTTAAPDTIDTGTALQRFERRLRAENVPVWCVSKRIAPPKVVARNHANQPCDFYLALATDNAGRRALMEAADDTQNEQWLAQTGLRVRMSHAKKRADYKQLPKDLRCTDKNLCEVYFDANMVRFYDPKLNLDVLHNYARTTARDKPSECLSGTGVQVVRTSVTPDKWPAARAAFVAQAQQCLPLCEAPVINCVREEVVPIGFQVFGTTNSPVYLGTEQQEIVLFDMFTVQLKRYHIVLSADEAAWIESLEARAEWNNDDEKQRFHELLAERANTVVEEMNGLTPRNVHRHVKWTVRESTANEQQSDRGGGGSGVE